ncbi:RluA family pseudouridine synthase [Butyrivibrio sp. YAB3001]|uniref:RluA family pseudouridine synthase n=1 Tax=Butyrivibrio sp. YAB3001 TaxID=1520812 RepID=UPI00158828A5|nr:RluA family pseudouridine synthase [Butyrivibrio sp. YAB3001]
MTLLLTLTSYNTQISNNNFVMDMSFRELRYKVSFAENAEDVITAGEIMRDIMHLSSREVSRCKKFSDGVMVIRNAENEVIDSDTINQKSSFAIDELREASNKKMLPIRLIDNLFPGDELIVRVYEDNENAGDIVPVDGPIEVVYEDEDLIVLNKPGDMVVHPSYAHYRDSLSNYLAGYFEKTGQNHVIRTIGRLDRETSGLVIFAKNRHSAALLSKQKENMSRRKEYLALCQGVFEVSDGTINAPIERKENDRMIREVNPNGKEAITHYHVEKQYDDYALVRLKLDTGRTHQIRVHMSYIGHPLLGDNFYGKEIEDNHGMTRAALHAGYIEFAQPISGEIIKLKSMLPSDMQNLV